MSDVAETKPDPTTAVEEQHSETATGEGEKTVTETAVDAAKDAAEAAKDTAAKTSDSVFSMFGGGPKKEKKEETEEGADEPSGSSKAQQAEEVSYSLSGMMFICLGTLKMGLSWTWAPLRKKNTGARGHSPAPRFVWWLAGLSSCSDRSPTVIS